MLIVPALILAAPAHALIMVSEARSVFVSYYGSGIEMHSSPGTFGAWTGSAIGTPFGGGNVSAYQQSNITSTGFALLHSTHDNYGPGGVAESRFRFTFSLTEATRINITGFSNTFAGSATLTGHPLIWTGMYQNNLDFDQVLGVGLYTFETMEWLRWDNPLTRITLREGPPRAGAESVPDSGSTAGMLGLALAALVVMRRR